VEMSFCPFEPTETRTLDCVIEYHIYNELDNITTNQYKLQWLQENFITSEPNIHVDPFKIYRFAYENVFQTSFHNINRTLKMIIYNSIQWEYLVEKINEKITEIEENIERDERDEQEQEQEENANDKEEIKHILIETTI